MDNFVKANDFTGKTVIPFCTSASSGIGDSGKLLEDMAGTGNWKEGERFRGGASESEKLLISAVHSMTQRKYTELQTIRIIMKNFLEKY